ncbi:DciA family protein [Nannocystis bainbridge]|uniref:DciA family protein n=1 Tax=Nannocystis bainbridge TaxID=2995303 RepID=A0ABT5EAT4_9BACT|nr:DciA family protein [Nannocystis bainbridge]MDC0722966.1 DciA family protein [Nannocystis bainbridge]
MAARRPRRSFARGPQPLADAVWRLVKTIVPDHMVRLVYVRAAWERLNMPWLRGRAYPLAVVRDEVIVVVEDSQYHHELMYSRDQLLGKLQQLAPEARLGGLRFRLGAVPTPSPRPLALPAAALAPPTMTAEPSDATSRAMSDVSDPELRQAIAGARILLGR